MLGEERLGKELRDGRVTWIPEAQLIGLEISAGLVNGLEVLRLEGMRWVGQDFGGSLVLRHMAYCQTNWSSEFTRPVGLTML